MANPPDALARALSDRYSIDGEIGRGGMATVYAARDQRHDRVVALKVLLPEIAASVGAERFLREIQIAAGLRHPHILPLYESGEADGFLYYVMPYEEGQSLRDRLRRDGALPVGDVVKILRDVADALACAHEHGIVHRDIKPDNILVSGRHAVVTDFGVAKALSDASATATVTATGVTVGTALYMAPEQAAGEPHLDHRADIYALGVLGYELLVGAPPFSGSMPAVIAAHVTQRPPEVSSLRSAVPEELSAIIDRCLEKAPADRFQRAEHLIAALEGVATDGLAPPSRRGRAGSRWRVPPVARGVAATLVVGAALAWGVLRPAVTAPRVAVIPLANQTGVDSLDAIGAIAAEMITNALVRAGVRDIAPTQTVLAAGLSGGARGSSSASRAIAQETGATHVISGTYSMQGDSLLFQAQLVDPVNERVLAPIEPVVVRLGDDVAGIQGLGEHIAVVLSAQLNATITNVVAVSDLPMSMPAYRAYITGVEQFLGGGPTPSAIRNLQTAAALDPDAVQPLLWLSIAIYGSTQPTQAADSVLRLIGAKAESLAPFDRAAYEWLDAIYLGDREAALVAGRTLREMGWGIPNVFSATSLLRLAEARAVLEEELVRPSSRKSVYTWFWVSAVYHQSGEHERELAEARGSVQDVGRTASTVLGEARALAALGRVAEVRERIEELRGMRQGTRGLMNAVMELRWHGSAEAANELGTELIGWLRDEANRSGAADARRSLGAALFFFGDADEARDIFQAWSADHPDDDASMGYLGADAARRGDGDAANRIIEWFDAQTGPYLNGSNRLWQAEIAAQMGDCPRTVGFLRQAVEEGQAYPVEDPFLAPVRGCRDFERLMAPKG